MTRSVLTLDGDCLDLELTASEVSEKLNLSVVCLKPPSLPTDFV
jgi:hypothetical protein